MGTMFSSVLKLNKKEKDRTPLLYASFFVIIVSLFSLPNLLDSDIRFSAAYLLQFQQKLSPTGLLMNVCANIKIVSQD